MPLIQVVERLAELDGYVSCVEGLLAALESAGDAVLAAGLLALRAYLAATRAEADYRRLADELPGRPPEARLDRPLSPPPRFRQVRVACR